MDVTIPYFGQVLALLVAVIWAFAVILFKKSGETVHPIALTLFKNLLALILFLPTMWLFKQPLVRQIPGNEYLLFLISGVIGMGIADMLFFKSLNLIGAGLSAIVTCIYSPFIIGLSVLWLGERLSFLQIIGVVLIVSAVSLTIRIKLMGKISRRDLLWGILWGVLSTAATAVGIVMIKPLLGHTPILWATEIRLFSGFITLVLITLFHPARRRIITSLFSSRSFGYTVAGSFVGTYLALTIWLAGMKYTQASIAAALNQTSSIFVFIFAALILKEPITLRRTVAIILAVSGAFLVFLG